MSQETIKIVVITTLEDFEEEFAKNACVLLYFFPNASGTIIYVKEGAPAEVYKTLLTFGVSKTGRERGVYDRYYIDAWIPTETFKQRLSSEGMQSSLVR